MQQTKIIIINISITFLIFTSILFLLTYVDEINAQSNKKDIDPVLTDQNLKTDIVIDKLKFPIGMEFIGNDDFLVIEKNTGKVKRVTNGQVVNELLDLNVASKSERGLLGIAFLNTSKFDNTVGENPKDGYVFLFLTETEGQDDGEILGNKLYRYEFIDGTLVNPVLLLDLPYLPGPSHNGGV
ncbi:MAG: hypothetical protein R3321_01540, partial [Nitrososphaeraceae archaeon]|nr:hypothetical protein [Nitrososphaeraceae archaeon]